ncbi:hypothetical protein [Dyadobacter koreensis]|nr:hypothetical protein [Dyadobacter koreensis]
MKLLRSQGSGWKLIFFYKQDAPKERVEVVKQNLRKQTYLFIQLL